MAERAMSDTPDSMSDIITQAQAVLDSVEQRDSSEDNRASVSEMDLIGNLAEQLHTMASDSWSRDEALQPAGSDEAAGQGAAEEPDPEPEPVRLPAPYMTPYPITDGYIDDPSDCVACTMFVPSALQDYKALRLLKNAVETVDMQRAPVLRIQILKRFFDKNVRSVIGRDWTTDSMYMHFWKHTNNPMHLLHDASCDLQSIIYGLKRHATVEYVMPNAERRGVSTTIEPNATRQYLALLAKALSLYTRLHTYMCKNRLYETQSRTTA